MKNDFRVKFKLNVTFSLKNKCYIFFYNVKTPVFIISAINHTEQTNKKPDECGISVFNPKKVGNHCQCFQNILTR